MFNEDGDPVVSPYLRFFPLYLGCCPLIVSAIFFWLAPGVLSRLTSKLTLPWPYLSDQGNLAHLLTVALIALAMAFVGFAMGTLITRLVVAAELRN